MLTAILLFSALQQSVENWSTQPRYETGTSWNVLSLALSGNLNMFPSFLKIHSEATASWELKAKGSLVIDDFDSDKLGTCFIGIIDEISSYNEFYTTK